MSKKTRLNKSIHNTWGKNNVEKALIFFTIFVLTLASCLILIEGVANLLHQNYTSLGDPYYSKNISAFERLPFVAKTTAGTIALIIIIEGSLTIKEKISHVGKKD